MSRCNDIDKNDSICRLTALKCLEKLTIYSSFSLARESAIGPCKIFVSLKSEQTIIQGSV